MCWVSGRGELSPQTKEAKKKTERNSNCEKEKIITKLRENGCRITKQRKMILDIIMENRCSSCKEIYVQAAKRDQSIGMATVYRLVNELENIGMISRKIVYKQ